MIATKQPHLEQSPSSSKICLTAYFGNMAQKPNLYPQFKVKARTIKKKTGGTIVYLKGFQLIVVSVLR